MRYFLILLIIIITTGFFGFYWAKKNYDGYCRETGQIMSLKAIKEKIRRNVLREINNEKKIGGAFSFLISNKSKSLKKENPRFSIKKIKKLENLEIYIYPNFPKFSKTKITNINNKTYITDSYDPSHSGKLYLPVNDYNKYTGYAKDLYFLEISVLIEPIFGSDWMANIQWRGWLDNCANDVKIPEKYEIG